jgi:hypothetical protein
VRDFVELCALLNLRIDQAVSVSGEKARRVKHPGTFANLTSEQAIFLLSRKS